MRDTSLDDRSVGFRTRRGVLHPYKRETSESSESGGSSTATANHCPTWTCDSTISRTRSTNPDTDPDDPSSYFTYSRQNSQLSLLTNRDWYSDCDRFSLSSSSVNGHRAALSHAEDTSEEFSEPLPDVNLGILELTLVYDSETSSIHVSLHRAKNLKPMDINGLADPFCKLNLLPAGTKSHRLRTRTVHKTRNPEFNETLTFYGITENDLAVRALHVLVLDDDKYGHDFMGEAKYPLDRLRPDVARQLNLFLEKHYPVENEEEVWGEEGWTHGQILITLCYSTRRKALIVGIVRCNNLLPMDSNGFSDPFVKLYLRPDHYHRKYKTCVKWKNLNPIFNEEFVFETKMTDLPQQTLVLTVWDKDYGKSNDYLEELGGTTTFGVVGRGLTVESSSGETEGCLELGWKSKGERLRQWVDMIKFPDHKHEGLHNLCEEPPPN
ncbi:double C2-like [Homalodisca vitripennis]|nr:double C2-like [Homalodisca vitripennis]